MAITTAVVRAIEAYEIETGDRPQELTLSRRHYELLLFELRRHGIPVDREQARHVVFHEVVVRKGIE